MRDFIYFFFCKIATNFIKAKRRETKITLTMLTQEGMKRFPEFLEIVTGRHNAIEREQNSQLVVPSFPEQPVFGHEAFVNLNEAVHTWGTLVRVAPCVRCPCCFRSDPRVHLSSNNWNSNTAIQRIDSRNFINKNCYNYICRHCDYKIYFDGKQKENRVYLIESYLQKVCN